MHIDTVAIIAEIVHRHPHAHMLENAEVSCVVSDTLVI